MLPKLWIYLAGIGRAKQDTEYMPELEGAMLADSPRIARATVWIAGLLLIVALTWANYAVLEEVTTGEGKAIPSSKIQTIQNLEGGIVAEIFVREGQVVNKGDTLLRLDSTRFRSNQEESEVDRLALLAQIERLTAEAEGKPLALSQEIIQQSPQLAEDERALYESRQQRLHSEQRTLREQLIQKQQEQAEFLAKQQQYRSSLGLIQQELNMSTPLVASGAISAVEVLRLRRSLVEVRGALDATTQALPRAEAAASSVAIQDRVSRTTVTSPVKGIIKQLKINTIGGVVQPGSDMLEIVPLEDNLLIEARVRPQDVAFLHPGQNAMVKFNAYDYTIYGGLKANLELISADTIVDKDGRSFYLIQVRTDKNHLGSDDHPLLIIPGMVATVDIITGEKSVLDYLLKPVLKARAEALRER